MDTRLAAVKCLIKIFEQDVSYDETINAYVQKINSVAELINLVSGTVKFKLKLDYFIANVSSRKKISPPLRNILRAAIYEIEFLKTPDYAVISSYVDITKKYDRNSSGFVNAVLRNFLKKQEEINSKIKTENMLKAISIEYSHPEWLVDRWINTYGIEETLKICEFNNKIPVLSLRINTFKASKQEIIDLLTKNNIEFTESTISEDCLILQKTGNIKNIAGFKEGLWSVQGEVSSLVAKILDPQPDERVLDLCAAPGGKTTHIAALMNDCGEITAVDSDENRIKKVSENALRLGIKSVKTVIADAMTFSNLKEFDRILIDAPCSNTGVLAKRPDARWKRKSEDIKNLTEIQLGILENASKLLKKEGVLVYSTCSIESEENLLLIQQFLANNKDFQLQDISKYLPWKEEGKEGYIQILQSRHNIEGFFIAKFIRSCLVKACTALK